MKRRYLQPDLDILTAKGLGAKLPAPKPRRRNLESEMQRALIIWWHRNCAKFGAPECLLFSIPNGFNADPKRGSVLKLEGLRKGAPDLFLAKPVARPVGEHDDWRTTSGLFLELKAPHGHVSAEQEAFHELLRRQSYKCEVVWSLPDAINAITNYLTK